MDNFQCWKCEDVTSLEECEQTGCWETCDNQVILSSVLKDNRFFFTFFFEAMIVMGQTKIWLCIITLSDSTATIILGQSISVFR